MAHGRREVDGGEASVVRERVVLLAVDGPQNESKGDDDASEWRPPRTLYDCRYVAKQVTIKSKYKLWVTKAEHDAIAAVVAAWPNCSVP